MINMNYYLLGYIRRTASAYCARRGITDAMSIDDYVGDAVAAVYTRMPGYNPDRASPATWVNRITIWSCGGRSTDEAARPEHDSLDEIVESEEGETTLVETLTSADPGPEAVVALHMVGRSLSDSISGLPHGPRAVMRLMYNIEEPDGLALTQTQTAQALGMSQSSVSRYHDRGIQLLAARHPEFADVDWS